MIDDLDRCHDHKMIIGLLEQIKLFLDIEGCIFIIGADKARIVEAINETFPGQGGHYLEKFVQLPINLFEHQGNFLMEMMGIDNPALKRYMLRVADLLDNNPRKIKQLWNEAVLSLAIVKNETQRVQLPDFNHPIKIELMIKWLLISKCKPFKANPALYMKYDSPETGNAPDLHSVKGREFCEKFVNDLIPENRDGNAVEKDDDIEKEKVFYKKLAFFIWREQNVAERRFKDYRTLRLYANAGAKDDARDCADIERACFDGDGLVESRDFSNVDLIHGRYKNAVFRNCRFSFANLEGADLTGAVFEKCNLDNTRFVDAKLDNAKWKWCSGIDAMDIEPEVYETIAEKIIGDWIEYSKTEKQPKGWIPVQLFKMYMKIIDLYMENNLLGNEIEERLKSRAKKIKEMLREEGIL